LRFAQRHGYATSRGEIFVGAVAVSAPYFDHRGQIIGSVGLYGPNARIDEQKLLEYSKLVRQAGRRISVLLGFQGTESARKDDSPLESSRRKRSS
jgi:DNA-binding IclR family transcriptional regulator